MNALISVLLIAASLSGFATPLAPAAKPEDFKTLTGGVWTGSLSYLDYGRNKRVSIPSRLAVSQSPSNKSSWVFEFQYPDEPKENSKDTVTVSKDGARINDEMVVERGRVAGNALKIVTKKSGSDNDREAVFRYTYLIGRKAFSIRKEVKYDGATDFFVRNEFSWTR